jgi:hypothetical protein
MVHMVGLSALCAASLLLCVEMNCRDKASLGNSKL